MLFQWAWTGEKSTNRFKQEKRQPISPNKAKWDRVSLCSSNTKKNGDWNNNNEHMNKSEISKTHMASVIHNQASKQSPKQQEEKMKNSESEDETRDTPWTYLRAPPKQRLLDFSMLLLHSSYPARESLFSQTKLLFNPLSMNFSSLLNALLPHSLVHSISNSPQKPLYSNLSPSL